MLLLDALQKFLDQEGNEQYYLVEMFAQLKSNDYETMNESQKQEFKALLSDEIAKRFDQAVMESKDLEQMDAWSKFKAYDYNFKLLETKPNLGKTIYQAYQNLLIELMQ